MVDQETKEVYRKILRAWYSAHKNTLLYSISHPSAQDSGAKLSAALSEALQKKLELSIQHADGLFVIEDQFFIEESLFMYDLLRALETFKIVSVVFLPGVTPAEIMTFTTQLLVKPTAGQVPTIKVAGPRLRVYQQGDKDLVDLESRRRSAAIRRVMGLYEQWSHYTETVLSKLLDEQNLPLSDLSRDLEILIDGLNQSPAGFSMAIALKEKTNLHAQHSLHTMLLSLFLGQQLGLDQASLKSLGISALVHDVGRLLLPSDLTSAAKLTPADIATVQHHARDGAALLANVPGLPTTVARVALEHHIGFDGQGYPSLPASHQPHVFSQIVGLADFISWGTTSNDAYNRPVPFYRLIRSMLRRSGSQFDPLLIKLMLPFFGLYPPGTEIALTDGRTAVAMEPNLRNFTRPSVVLEGQQGPAFGWLADLGNPPAASFSVSVSKALRQKWLEDSFLDLIPGETSKPDE